MLCSLFGLIGFLLLPVAWFEEWKAPRTEMIALTWLTVVALGYVFAGQWLVTVQYYYDRYLMSEAYPFCLLLISVFLYGKLVGRSWQKNVAALSLGFMVFHGLYYASYQLKGREGIRDLATYRRILKHADANDLVLIDAESFDAFDALKTPLILYMGLNVATMRGLRDSSMSSRLVNDLGSLESGSVYVLSAGGMDQKLFEPVDKFALEHTHFEFFPQVPQADDHRAVGALDV